MPRRRLKPATPPVRRGLDVSRYRRPPRRAMSKPNREMRWQTFRIVLKAIRLLAFLRLHISPASIANATAFLAIGIPDCRRISEKTMLGNDLCFCVYEVWRTTKAHPRRRSRPIVQIPRSLMDKSAAELREMYVLMQADRDRERAGRLQAIAAQKRASPAREDSLNRRLAELAALALGAQAGAVPREGA